LADHNLRCQEDYAQAAQLAIWYAKHLPSRKQGATEGSGGTANLNKSDYERCQHLRVNNDSASDDENLNGGGEVPVLHQRLWVVVIKKHVVFDWLGALHYDCDSLRLVARITVLVIR
jgi:hypothetical protein